MLSVLPGASKNIGDIIIKGREMNIATPHTTVETIAQTFEFSWFNILMYF